MQHQCVTAQYSWNSCQIKIADKQHHAVTCTPRTYHGFVTSVYHLILATVEACYKVLKCDIAGCGLFCRLLEMTNVVQLNQSKLITTSTIPAARHWQDIVRCLFQCFKKEKSYLFMRQNYSLILLLDCILLLLHRISFDSKESILFFLLQSTFSISKFSRA